MHYLSKSSFTEFWQCPKMLWLDIHRPELFDPSLVDEVKLAQGDEIGELARKRFGAFATIKQTFDFPAMAEETEFLLNKAWRNSETGALCEATFVYDNLVCMADVVKVRPDGTLDVIEVKSSTQTKEYHLWDLAFQVFTIECTGWTVNTTCICHVDSTYVLSDEFDLCGFFATEDVTDEVRKIIKSGVPEKAAEAALLDTAVCPEIVPGKRCNSPHPCGYQRFCSPDVPEWMSSLSSASRAKALEWYKAGIRTPADLIAAEKATKLQTAQIEAMRGTDRVMKDKVRDFLDTLSFPLYFLDFETVQPAIPKWKGTKPYQQIPTQFSLHWLDEPGGELHHTEYLAPVGEDPRRGVAEALVRAIPEEVCCTAYNMGFENGRIKEMAEAFPDLAGHLLSIKDNMRDLIVPFRSGHVCLASMQNSYSIKKVLPALCPDDPALDYHALEGVHNGTEAMAAFAELERMTSDEQATVREQLLRYCELDTLAMVRVWERLTELAR